MARSAGRRLVVGVVIVLATAAAAWGAPPAWTPPGLSNAETQEWKDGRPPGWSQGAKRGWHGKSCPPGQAKKGRCGPSTALSAEQRAWEERLRERIERLRRWGRDTLRLPQAVLDALVVGFEGAARHQVPIDIAERLAMDAASHTRSAYGIESITRAVAWGTDHGAAPADLDAFARQSLARGVPPESIALGIYRLAADAKR